MNIYQSNSKTKLIFKFLVLATFLLFSKINLAAVVHIGSFSITANAHKLKKRLNNMGFRAIVLKQKIDNELLNSVLIKDISNYNAVKTCDKLKYKSIRCYVILDGVKIKKETKRKSSNSLPLNQKYRKSNNGYRPIKRKTKKYNYNNKGKQKPFVPITSEEFNL